MNKLNTFAFLGLTGILLLGGSTSMARNYKQPMTDEEKRAALAQLTPLQRSVTQESDTEAPFHNEYWDNHADGIYVDRVSGEPLFSSLDKYDSGTGWPSFSKPIKSENVTTKKDIGLMTGERTEVRSKSGDSHLGHVFNDGPKEAGGQRFCMNSASLKFIPAAELEKSGYPEYVSMFPKIKQSGEALAAKTLSSGKKKSP